jgi:hypothetical protein
MTAPVANPSLRWLAAYAAAALAGTVFATAGTSAVAGAAPPIGVWVTRILPFTVIALFVPVAVASFLLLKAGLWTRPGFIIAGAAIPALFLLVVLALGNTPGANFAASLVVWTISGAVAGAVFHQVWEKLS